MSLFQTAHPRQSLIFPPPEVDLRASDRRTTSCLYFYGESTSRMNLDLLYQWPGGRQWFSAGDIVRGCVVIDAPRTEQIESAVIFLYGRVKVSCAWSQDDFAGSCTKRARQQIFMASKSVLSYGVLHSDKTFGPGVHFLPFTIAFPSFAEHAPRERLRKNVAAELPPSLYICGQNIKVDVAYFLSARLKRRGSFRLNKSKKKELPFRLANTNLLSLPGNFSGMVKFVALPAENFQIHQRPPTSYNLLPPYTPSIRLQLAMPSQVLQPEEPLSLQLNIFTPHELLRQLGTLTLRSLLFRIQITTTTAIGGLSKRYVTSRGICYLSGSISLVPPPEEEVCRLDPSLWQSYLVPSVQPSFASQDISRTHVLEITAGFSAKDQQNIQYVCLTADVALVGDPKSHDPPPPYCQQ